MVINKFINVDGTMALTMYKGMKYFKRYNDPQKNEGNDISLKIRLTNRCNYKCHYCAYRNNSEEFLKWNQLEKILTFIESLTKDYFYIYLHGGEPTIHPDFIKFVHSIDSILTTKNVEYFIYFDTNFTMKFEDFQTLLTGINISKFKINCTYHVDQCLDYEKFLDKYLKLTEYKIQTQLNIMFQYKYFDRLKNMFDTLTELKYINVVPKPISYNNEESKYSIEQKQFFYDNDPRIFYYIDYKNCEHTFNINQMELNNYNNFSLLKCEYGEKNIVIDVSGDMFYCVSHQLGRTKKNIENIPISMNIFNDPIENYYNASKPKICLYNTCSACDLRILKRGL